MRDADKEQTKEEDMASRHVTLKENFSQAFCIFIEESKVKSRKYLQVSPAITVQVQL